ncbi:MAG: R3H domain-containing nucleic acid-binding protein [Anaerolineae bacterium]
MHARFTGEINALLAVFPEYIRTPLEQQPELDNLIEVVMDLGRRPKAYFTDKEIILSTQEVQQQDIDAIAAQIGEFMADNRARIERTLHRISAIRNRQQNIVGLTCRVGRAIYGTIDIVQDLLNGNRSILLLGRPGVGKTTMLREAARILAETKRVIVVDTSNEIAGDGDIPHPAIGKARRMQVPSPELQHQVMIEAVENHTPEVIIIDEIGRLEEAEAARTIAERGVQLIGTAHGNTLDNLLVNPTLANLVGGIDSVTLSDEEARRRSTQKTVLERRSPPTFDILVEIQTRDTLAVHHNVAKAVDALLRGRAIQPEIRFRDEEGQIQIEQATVEKPRLVNKNQFGPPRASRPDGRRRPGTEERPGQNPEAVEPQTPVIQLKPVKVFPYGANQSRLRQAARGLQVPVILVDALDEADILITVKSHYRKHPQPIIEAEQKDIPLYVLRSNTVPQMETCLADIFSLSPQETDPLAIAMRETQAAIRKVLQGAKSAALNPQDAFIRRKQHEMARQSNLISHSHGKDPQRRVKIYRA